MSGKVVIAGEKGSRGWKLFTVQDLVDEVRTYQHQERYLKDKIARLEALLDANKIDRRRP